MMSVAVVGGGIGGLAAALSLLSEGVDVHVYEQSRSIGEAGAGIAVSPIFLIVDLGKPSRFYNMLRVAKPTSPMSMGTWLISPGSARVVGASGLVFGYLGPDPAPRLPRYDVLCHEDGVKWIQVQPVYANWFAASFAGAAP